MITSLFKHAVLVAALAGTFHKTIAFPLVSNGLENIIVETYYVSNAADSIQADAESTDNGLPTGSLPVGSVTYRIYVDMLPGYKLLAVYADKTRGNDLKVTTTTSFYNNPSGSTTSASSKTSIKNKLRALDSWVSLGGVATGQYGILKSEDNGLLNNVTTASNTAGVLLNTDTAAGIPLTTQDGMITGTGIQSASFLGFNDELAVFGDGTVVGNSITVIDGSVFTTDGAIGPDAGNKILIAQVTTNGHLTFELNLLLKAPDSTTEYYVAKDPKDNRILFPGLNR